MEIKEIQAKNILTPQKVGSLKNAFDFSLNPYAGCAFRCSYCYVPKFPNARHEPSEWGSWVEVKMNAPQLLQRDRLKVFGSRIFFSSATDPYQYLELKYRLSRQCLEMLLRYQPARVTMHTRSHLILQDIELLKKFGDKLRVGVSITTDIESVRREFEPGAPSVERRMDLIKQLHEAGIDVYASVSPLLPCNPEKFGAMLRPFVNKAWVSGMNWIEVNQKPELLKKYESFFKEPNYSANLGKVQKHFRHAADEDVAPTPLNAGSAH